MRNYTDCLMKNLIILFFISLCLDSYGQAKKLTDDQLNFSGANKLLLLDNINKVKAIATNDIKRDIPFLLLQSGEAPIGYPADSLFQSKYNINYFEFGCIGPTIGYAAEYNKYSFEYLDAKFGKKWRREIRKDVIGLKQYRKSK